MKKILLITIFIGLMAAANSFAAGSDSRMFQEYTGSDSTQANAPIAVESKLDKLDIDSYFDWGRAQNGWGYCYEWTYDGRVLNGGMPVNNYMCESVHPSYHYWGRSVNGWGYCYQFTPYHIAMNEGMPMANYNCEIVAPSYYAWGRSINGYFYCYQHTANGFVMNEGMPVANFYCQ